MDITRHLGLAGLVALLTAGGSAIGGQTQAPGATPPESAPPPQEEWSVTEHSVRIDGRGVPYVARAGTTLITNDEGEPTGLIYSAAYTRSDVADPATRPVAFLFNGGPGSASLWLHMGAFGPRRVATLDGTFTPPAPYQLVDNNESLLDVTDLVFIDAMGTGYSRAAGEATERDFYGVDEDADAFARFIVTYLSRNGRWNSPKVIIGESYGTFRAAVLTNLLQSRYAVHVNGVDLLSSVLDLSTITFAPGDDRVYTYYLPSYAAVAWYHEAVSRRGTLEAFVDEARRYAEGEYAAALFKGSALTPGERSAVAGKLAYFTGLSEDYLLKANLRVTLGQFNAELLRSRGLTAGRIDARFTGYTFNRLTESAESDPEGPAVGGAFTALVNHYNHEELEFGRDLDYRTRRLGGGWNWTRQSAPQRGFPSAPNAQSDLAQAMITNPRLLVQVENGYYDMATPFFPSEFTMRHLGIPAELEKNIALKYYEAGHMMYLRDEDRVALKKNLAAFIAKATRP